MRWGGGGAGGVKAVFSMTEGKSSAPRTVPTLFLLLLWYGLSQAGNGATCLCVYNGNKVCIC